MQVVIIKRAFGSNPYARFELGNCKKLGSKNIRVFPLYIFKEYKVHKEKL